MITIFFNKEVGEPIFFNWIFPVTLVIFGIVPSQLSNFQGREFVVVGGWSFDIVVGITLSNHSHELVLILELDCVIY